MWARIVLPLWGVQLVKGCQWLAGMVTNQLEEQEEYQKAVKKKGRMLLRIQGSHTNPLLGRKVAQTSCERHFRYSSTSSA